MAWFILARVAFVAAVAYSAFLLRPIHPDPLINVAFGLALAVASVGFEWTLRHTPVTHMLGAVLGGAIGLLRQWHRRGVIWVAPGDHGRVLHIFVPPPVPVPRPLSAGKRRVSRAGAAVRCSCAGPDRHYSSSILVTSTD